MRSQADSSQRRGMAFWKWLLLPWMAGVILAVYLGTEDLNMFREPASARILFWHVPVAELCMAWFFAAAVYAGRFLYGSRRGSLAMDRKSDYANQIGLLLTFLTTITGMVFAARQWGQAWSWDPKQVGITILLMVYLAYFGLRMAIEDPDLRGRLSGVYSIIAAVLSPVLVFVIPQLLPMVQTLHPGGSTIYSSSGLAMNWRIIFWASTLGFFGITLWIYQLRLRIADLEEAAELRAERGREVDGMNGKRTEAVRAPAIRS